MTSQISLTSEQFAAIEPEMLTRTMQIIAGALVMGVISFAVVLWLTWDSDPAAPAPAPGVVDPMVMIAVIFTSVAVIARFTIPGVVARSQVAQVVRMYQANALTGTKEFFGRMMMIAQTKMIIEFALLEGVCFFNLIAVRSSHSLIPAGLTLALLLVMAWSFPTKNKLLNWLEDQRNRIADV